VRTKFRLENLKGRDHSGDLFVNGLIILRMHPTIRYIGLEGVDWIYPARDRARWRALENRVISLWVPYKVGYFLTGLTYC
jgi:hypothetical protein